MTASFDWIAHHGATRPDKLASVDLATRRRFTYSEMNERCDRRDQAVEVMDGRMRSDVFDRIEVEVAGKERTEPQQCNLLVAQLIGRGLQRDGNRLMPGRAGYWAAEHRNECATKLPSTMTTPGIVIAHGCHLGLVIQ